MTIAIALFSGGLDSILAARVIMDQGVKVKCLHFYSPFFGNPDLVNFWKEQYNVDVECIDIGEEFIAMLRCPEHGFGKVMNPCMDCKILMMTKAKSLLEKYGASFIISGEVLGQRPMSQRRDALNVISKQAKVRDELVRPLSAKMLKPSMAEINGLLDREKLLGFFGRGRKDQLALAKYYGFTEIPTPAGGCRLGEKENARRYLPVLKYFPQGLAREFYLANLGRQYWAKVEDKSYWLSIGRDDQDNTALLNLKQPEDVMLKIEDVPGPLALGRFGLDWPENVLKDAMSFMASYAPKAKKLLESGQKVQVRVLDTDKIFTINPSRETALAWSEDSWESTREEIKNLEPKKD